MSLPLRTPLRLALGTDKITGPHCTTHIQRALSLGYRHIDTAQAYGNESAIGAALRTTPVPRSSLFLATKISAGWKKNPATVAEARASALASVERLGAEYLDLMLVHAAGDDGGARRATWEALGGLVGEGVVRGVGVCNFSVGLLGEVVRWERVKLSVVQMELHPWNQQRAVQEFCKEHGIHVQAHTALARNTYADHPRLNELAAKYAKSPAQMLIRYSLQKGWTPVVKAKNPAHLASNTEAEAEGFEIDEGDMAEMDEWDRGRDGAVIPWLLDE